MVCEKPVTTYKAMHPTADQPALPMAAAPLPGSTRTRLLRESSSRVAAALAQAQMQAQQAHAQAQSQAQAEEPAAQQPSPETQQSDKLIRLQSLLTEFLHS